MNGTTSNVYGFLGGRGEAQGMADGGGKGGIEGGEGVGGVDLRRTGIDASRHKLTRIDPS
jgi:hypothetical protein